MTDFETGVFLRRSFGPTRFCSFRSSKALSESKVLSRRYITLTKAPTIQVSVPLTEAYRMTGVNAPLNTTEAHCSMRVNSTEDTTTSSTEAHYIINIAACAIEYYRRKRIAACAIAHR